MPRTENVKQQRGEETAKLTGGPSNGRLFLLGRLDELVKVVRMEVVRGKTEHGQEDAERDVEDNPEGTSKQQRGRGVSWC